MRQRQVVVIGSYDDTKHQDIAYRIGKHIAEKGWALISGGRSGIMEAASKGAYEAGGIVVGILPDDSFESANKYCSIVVPTGIGYARNLTNVLSGDVIISIGGGSGTLSEMAYAWQYGRPVIACRFTGGWSERMQGPVDGRGTGIIRFADSIEEVFAYMDELLN